MGSKYKNRKHMITQETPFFHTEHTIIDMSPVFYSNLISVTNQMKKSGIKKNQKTGKIPFIYKSELIYAIINEVISFNKHPGEKILAFDNSENGYWRKNIYQRHKYSRKRGRDESEIDWNAAFEVFNELKTILQYTSHKVVEVPQLEADDIAMVLSEYFQDKGGVTLVSLDGDWRLALRNKNTQVCKTRKTQRKEPIYEMMTLEEVEEKEKEMLVAGDPKDGIMHIKAWSQFSDEFLEEYPKFKGREFDLYERHHEIEHKFNLKHNFVKSAYKHPRFGYKSFKKSKKTLEELFEENPIYKKNYELNKKLCLPSSIPQEYKDKIIEVYKNANPDKNPGELTKYFMANNLFELTGSIGLL